MTFEGDAAMVKERQKQTILETASLSDKGRVREANEDSLTVITPEQDKAGKGTMLIVADGLGGHRAGEIASRMVVTHLPLLYYNSEGGDNIKCLLRAVDGANQAVYEAARRSEELRGMGSTVVAAVVSGQFLIIVHVGDSRCYVLHDGMLQRLTEDHSLRRESFAAFEEEQPSRFSHVLTQAIGPRSSVIPGVSIARLSEDDIILLCSDGLTEAVSEEEVEAVLLHNPVADAVQMLVDKANANGGEDNVSLILSQVVLVAFSDKSALPLKNLEWYRVLKSSNGKG